MSNITKSFVEKILPQGKEHTYWDDKLTGFGLKILPTGRKVYIYKYRTRDGRQRKPTIGVHGNITCEKARDIAETWSAQKSLGDDPSGQRQDERSAPTMAELSDKFITEHSNLYKKANSIAIDNLLIRKYIKPHLGTLKVTSVKHEDIAKLHSALRHTPAQANRLMGLLSKMFNMAERWNYRPRHSNPVENIQKYKEEKRQRFLSEVELTKLGEVLAAVEKTNQESLYFVALVRLLLLTGCRLREIMEARWEWVDEQNQFLILPDSKTGAKEVNLSDDAMKILAALPRLDNNPYIIVGEKEGHSMNNPQKPWGRIRTRAKLEGVRLHDLRHTFASYLLTTGHTLPMVAKLLGHRQTRTTERYAHLANKPVLEAANKVGSTLSKLTGIS